MKHYHADKETVEKLARSEVSEIRLHYSGFLIPTARLSEDLDQQLNQKL